MLLVYFHAHGFSCCAWWSYMVGGGVIVTLVDPLRPLISYFIFLICVLIFGCLGSRVG